MSQPYVGEIRMFGFGRTPNGWQACDGSVLAISEYEVLYALIGTTYGGNGQTTFAVPNLSSRVPIHQGTGPGLSNRIIGELAGSETVTLTSQQMPGHSHAMFATAAAATATVPGPGLLPGAVSGDTLYVNSPAGNLTAGMSPQMLTTAGGNQPHENRMPTLTVQFCIAWAGIFPSQG